jgi:hypothetical protein
MATISSTRNQEPRILPCTCVHPQQDQIHGTGNRVHNYALKHNNGTGGYRCTVCKNLKSK